MTEDVAPSRHNTMWNQRVADRASSAQRCTSCGTERPVDEMKHPLSVHWRVLEDLWECRDAEACYQAMKVGGGAR